MNVRLQVSLLVGVLVAAATSAASFRAYTAARTEAYETVDEFLEERADQASAVIDAFAERPRVPDGVERPAEPRGPLSERIVQDDSIVAIQLPADLADDIPASFRTEPDIELPAASSTAGPVTETVVVDGERYRMRTVTSESGAVVQIARSLAETDSTLAAIRTRLVLTATAVTLLAVALGWFAARRLARPLEDLSAAAETIAATGDLATPMPTTGSGGEVGRVSRSFSDMVAALDESQRRQQRLVVDAGHELRTPLTTLRTNAELLATGRLDAADEQRALASICAEVDELSDLTAELVELAAERPTDRTTERVDVAEVARGAAERAGRRHRRPVAVDGGPVVVDGRAAQLDRAVSNLLDNAVKYSPADSPILVSVRPGAVEVADVGPGIDPGDLPHVFDRFYRAARDRTVPGSGLGLAIVAKAAAEHGGEAYARNTDDGAVVGFTFEPAVQN